MRHKQENNCDANVLLLSQMGALENKGLDSYINGWMSEMNNEVVSVSVNSGEVQRAGHLSSHFEITASQTLI